MPTDISGETEGVRATVTNPLAVNVVTGNSEYVTNDIEEASATITYIGAENLAGSWYVKKIDTSSGTVFGHASVKNNSSYSTYDSAWTARASLTYQNFGDAF